MEKTKLAIMGAAGNMGTRISRTLKATGKYDLYFLEAGEIGIEKVINRGDVVSDTDATLAIADVVVFALPDHLIGKISPTVVPKMKSGAMLITLDPAAPLAGKLPARPDVTYFITHPGHPPVFNDEVTVEAKHDFFGSGIAKQSIVSAILQGPDSDFPLGEEISKDMFGPIIRSHKVTLEQMAILEPALSETVAATCCVIMKEAMDEAIRMGVPAEAARDFLLGHINIPLAIVFGEINWNFSQGAQAAIREGKKVLFKDDWKEQIFNMDAIRKSIDLITQS